VSTPGPNELVTDVQLAARRNTLWTVLLHHATASKAGMNVTDAQCVNLLDLDGPMTPGQLAQTMGITTGGAITAVIDRLEKAGFVRRTRDPDDRRRVIVELNPEALDRYGHYFEPIARASAEIFSSYTEEQQRFLLQFMRDFSAAMPDVVKEIQAMP
jgi:DNA-binding MarR family transcriptional regulator